MFCAFVVVVVVVVVKFVVVVDDVLSGLSLSFARRKSHL